MLEPGRRTGGDFLDLPSFHDDEEFDDEILQPARPWWRSPKGIAAIAGVLIIALLVGSFAVIHSRPTPITYQYATLATGGLVTTVSATGPVQGALYDVNFSGSGTIKEIDVSVGQQVKSGQVLAKLDPSSLQTALTQAQIQANNAYFAEQNAYISEQQAITKCNQEAATPNAEPFDCVQQAENQYAQAENSYALALQSVQTAQSNLADATLKAPHGGTIVAINGDVGGTPGTSNSTSSSSSSGSGSGGSSTFIQIANLSSLQVVADVNEADIGSVAVNQPVTFTVSAYSNRTFRGTISTISPIGQSSSSVVTFPVTINVDSTSSSGTGTGTSSTTSAAPSDPLLPGMTASITIITAQRSGVVLLPQTAVTFARSAITSTAGILTRTQYIAGLSQARQMLTSLESSNPTAEQDKPTATLVVQRVNGKWVATPVIVGLSNGTSYEVLAGLSAGAKVVIGETGGNITPVAASSGTGGFGGGGFGGGGFGGGGRGGGGFGGGGGSGGGGG